MERFNMSMRKYLKEVGVTSQQAIERAVREQNLAGGRQSSGPNGSDSEGRGLEPVVGLLNSAPPRSTCPSAVAYKY